MSESGRRRSVRREGVSAGLEVALGEAVGAWGEAVGGAVSCGEPVGAGGVAEGVCVAAPRTEGDAAALGRGVGVPCPARLLGVPAAVALVVTVGGAEGRGDAVPAAALELEEGDAAEEGVG